jgi:hypothetical protein
VFLRLSEAYVLHPFAVFIRFARGAIFVFVIACDAERAAEFFGQRRLAEQAGLFEAVEVGEVAQARQSPQRQEGRRRHISMGRARLRATRPGGDQIGAAQSGDHVAADVSAENVGDAGPGDRLKIRHRRQHQLLEIDAQRSVGAEPQFLGFRKPPIRLPEQRHCDTFHVLGEISARGALDVGFVVTVAPKAHLDLRIRKDRQEVAPASIAQPVDIEAKAEVELAIGDIATVLVRGGRREAQEEAKDLEARWSREVEPHLVAAGVADLIGLDAKIVDAQELDAGIKTKDAEMESFTDTWRRTSGVQPLVWLTNHGHQQPLGDHRRSGQRAVVHGAICQ